MNYPGLIQLSVTCRPSLQNGEKKTRIATHLFTENAFPYEILHLMGNSRKDTFYTRETTGKLNACVSH